MRCLFLLLVLLPLRGVAQDTLFTANIQMMSRGEIRNGGMTADPDNPNSEDRSAFVLDRERIVFGYQRDWLQLKTSIQHVGTWGQEGAASVGVYEAWAKMTARNGLFAQIGRLALAYDDERIIGSDDWAMAAMTHDALLLGYEGHGHKLHTFMAYNQNLRVLTEPGSYYSGGSRPYKTMHAAWYHYDVPKAPLGVSLLLMNIGMQAGSKDDQENNPPHTEWQLVYGGYLKSAFSRLTVEGSYYRQTGHDEHMARLKAWMAAVKAEWKLDEVWSAQTGYAYLSGDDYVAVIDDGDIGLPLHEVNKGFNPVYGSHHKFYGAMDFFFLSTYVNGFTPGLQDAFLGGTCRPRKGLTLDAMYHYLATGTELYGLKRTLGHEIEVKAAYALAPDVKLSVGYSFMTGTDTMERLKRASGDGSLRWAWVTLNISPRLFTAR